MSLTLQAVLPSRSQDLQSCTPSIGRLHGHAAGHRTWREQLLVVRWNRLRRLLMGLSTLLRGASVSIWARRGRTAGRGRGRRAAVADKEGPLSHVRMYRLGIAR